MARGRGIDFPSRIRKAELISLFNGGSNPSQPKKKTTEKAVKVGRGIKVGKKIYFSNLPAGYSINSKDDLLVVGGQGVTALVRDESGKVYVAKENLGSKSFDRELGFAKQAIEAGITARIVAQNKTTIVMEKLGQTLCEYKLSKGKGAKLNQDEMDQIYNLLRTAYAAGIRHNDFKCNNIMLHPTSKQWMLIDFGMSKNFKDIKDPLKVEIGTLNSMMGLSRNIIPPGWTEFAEFTIDKSAKVAPELGLPVEELQDKVPGIQYILRMERRKAEAVARYQQGRKKPNNAVSGKSTS